MQATSGTSRRDPCRARPVLQNSRNLTLVVSAPVCHIPATKHAKTTWGDGKVHGLLTRHPVDTCLARGVVRTTGPTSSFASGGALLSLVHHRRHEIASPLGSHQLFVPSPRLSLTIFCYPRSPELPRSSMCAFPIPVSILDAFQGQLHLCPFLQPCKASNYRGKTRLNS